MINLLAFCSEDETRAAIRSPWFDAARDATYATDGRILIEVPGRHELAVDDPEVKRPKLEAVLGQWDEARAYAPLPDLPAEDRVWCESCEGSGRLDCQCPDCNAGAHDCEACDGDGYYTKSQPIEFGPVAYDARLLRKVAQLPEVLFGPAADMKLPGQFTFPGGGRGFVMPIRKV